MFFVMAVGLALAIHLYLWWRLVGSTTVAGRWRHVGTAAIAAAFVSFVGSIVYGARVGSDWRGWLTAPGFLWLAVMFYLLLVLLALEVPLLVVERRLARRARAAASAARPASVPAGGPSTADDSGPERDAGPEPDHDPDRRLLLRRGAAVTAGLLAVGVTGFGVVRAYSPPRVRRLEVPLARLDARADGLRVVVLGDIHVGPLFGTGQVERMVERVNDLGADVIAVVGDVVTSEPELVRDSLLPLTGLRARYGTYYVTGNHEYYVGHEDWSEVAGELGLRVLRNERVEIVHGGGAVDLAGVNDVAGTEFDDPPDYAAALGDRDPSRPVVLMAHQPVAVRDAARYGVDLQLSGHTHGGQLYPFDFLVRLQQPVVSGLAEVDGTQVYVTNGVGFWGPPVRVGADPEITLLTLRSA